MNLWLTQRKGITNRSNHLPKKKNQTNNGPFILGLGQWSHQVPKKSMKKSHEHHNNDSNDRTLQKYRTQKVELSEMGFSLSAFLGNPYKNGFLYTFTYEPSSSQCLQKTSPFHSALSLSLLFYFTVCWGKLSGTLIFLVSVAAEVLGFVWFQFLCIIPNLGISGNCKLWLPNQALNTLVFFNCHN